MIISFFQSEIKENWREKNGLPTWFLMNFALTHYMARGHIPERYSSIFITNHELLLINELHAHRHTCVKQNIVGAIKGIVNTEMRFTPNKIWFNICCRWWSKVHIIYKITRDCNQNDEKWWFCWRSRKRERRNRSVNG